jgi:alkanesulfonate monooxygenase SsuD/methylene tetrahydromethanopterin reductase-like flavin-dependent oxidoreductase (luciferase family)
MVNWSATPSTMTGWCDTHPGNTVAGTFRRVSDLPATSPPRAVMVLSENTTLVPPHDLGGVVELARLAEQAGVHTVMLSEHVVLAADSDASGPMVNPRDYAAPGNQHPHTPWPDSVVLASAIVHATTTLRVALAAVITPLRHPLLLAKQLGTLDLLAGGRLVVQPTVSWSTGEYAALAVPFGRRGRILDEQLAAMHAAWTAPAQHPSAHHGEHFSYGDVWVEPRRGVPVTMWFGGQRLHDVLIQRIVRYGHGFHPFGAPTADELARLTDAMAAAGRSIDELELIGGIRGRFTGTDDVADLDEALAAVPEKVAAGYRSICFKPSMFTDSLDEVPDVCRRVVAALHAAG